MSRPNWKLVANLGDVNPIEHGGLLVYIDQNGEYPPEAAKIVPPAEGEKEWTVYRFVLERCQYADGILSDNEYHPHYPVWFAKNMQALADFSGRSLKKIYDLFTSISVTELAMGYDLLGECYGFDNLDQYEETLDYRQVFGQFYSQLQTI